ncbi:MAG: CCA-adding enzyme [Firmicutes bacterium]|nr:CCA-adding enzyme [Bacillota bacterium]
MEVVVSHSNADFDALGSLVAAKLLRPRALVCFPGHINKKVRELYSLYKDSLNLTSPDHINVQEISHLIVLDTQSQERIGKFRPVFQNNEVRLTIIDHHPLSSSIPARAKTQIEQVGATTTLLVEEIEARGLFLTPVQATVMAVAIYSDTGCLTTGTTSTRDAKAVSYLLAQKANLEVIASYVRSPLSEGQRSLFEELLTASRELTVKEAKVRLTSCEVNEYVDGLAVLASRLSEIDDCDACIVVVNMDGRVHLVGRSKNDRVNMHALMRHFGGSGHRQAAAATVKGKGVEELVGIIEQVLPLVIEPPIRAKDIMSTPVKSVNPETTMEEAGHTMLRSGHSGLPVVQDGRLIGIISRRDLDKANHHGLQNAPVKGFMSTVVVTVSADASMDEVQRLMMVKDIGRLPVVDALGAVIGIVTRTDVLRTLHGKSYPHWYQVTYRSQPENDDFTAPNINPLLEEHLGKKAMGLLLLIGQEAERQGAKAYLVGGLVRDIMLAHPNVDIDLVVEPEAIPFAKVMAKRLNATCVDYPKFGTATLTLPAGEQIDFATARTEFYAMPAALPDVQYATIRQDLYRRDFTINTLAVPLNPDLFGNLLDFYGGREDLKLGLVRVLYNLSFVEDPTRIIRAVRFEQRYGFALEEQSERFLRNALENGVLEKVSREKLRDELRLLFAEASAPKAILRMDELGIWSHILPNLRLTDRQIEVLRSVSQADLSNMDHLAVYCVILLLYRPTSEWPALVDSLRLSRKARDVALEVMEQAEELVRGLTDAESTPADLLLKYDALQAESRLLIAALAGQEGAKKLDLMHALGPARASLSGQDLIMRGVAPGPLLGRLLRELKKAHLERRVSSREDELEYLDRLLERIQKGGN